MLVLFSAYSNANDSKLLCNQISELQPKILELDIKYRSNSKEYLVHKRSSDGWVHESYLFLGEHDGKYIVAGLSDYTPHQEKTITKLEFDALINKFNWLLNENKFTVSDSDHTHCNQLIIRSATLSHQVTREGFPIDRDFTKQVRKLDSYFFM